MGKLKNELTWSKSRDGAFRECPRKYWNRYYGSWGGWERNADPAIRQLYLLKQVNGRHAWIGKEVHERVRMCLKMLKAGQTPDLSTQMDSMVATMRTRFKESKKGDWVHNPKHILRLFEHEHDFNLKAEKWVELREHAKNSLRGFFESPYFELAKSLPLDRWRAVEDLDSFEIDDTKIWVALDFAFEREDGGCTIVDWKTGKNADPSEHVLQMHTYAMHAHETWGYPLEKIRIVVYFLSRQHGDEFVPDPEGVKRSRAAIVQSVADMRGALVDQDANRNEAVMENFPMTDNRQRCNWCEFRGVCWPDGIDNVDG